MTITDEQFEKAMEILPNLKKFKNSNIQWLGFKSFFILVVYGFLDIMFFKYEFKFYLFAIVAACFYGIGKIDGIYDSNVKRFEEVKATYLNLPEKRKFT